jgi:HlyD family secretion protein
MRRLWAGLGLAVALATGSWFGYQSLWLPYQQGQQAAPFETIQAQRGNIVSTVSATGSMEPEAERTISFRSPGRVAEVLVKVGQQVVAGQRLATQDTTDLVLALAQAKISLQISEAELAKLEAPVSDADIAVAQAGADVAQANVAAAEAALVSAQASYDALVAGPSGEQKILNEAELRQAEANVRRAQQAYDQVKNLPNLGALPQAAELERATLVLEVAQAKAALTNLPPAAAALAAARNQIAQAEYALERARGDLVSAQSNLARLSEDPDPQDLQIARSQVQQAQLGQLQAENNLAYAQLVAPFEGVVSQVHIRPGEVSNTAQPDMVLLDLTRFHMEVLVDEIDVRQVQVGQPVRILVDALPDTELAGRITDVSLSADDAGGVVAYAVTIVPDAFHPALRAGMSATAFITTAEESDVLLLPNRYIHLDRNTGQAYVYKLVNGQPLLSEVELGLRNEISSEIRAGLDESETVALVTQSGEEQLRGVLFGQEE